MLQIYSIELNGNYGKPSGKITLTGDDHFIQVPLEEGDCVRMMNFGYDVFRRQQEALAEKVRAIVTPPQLTYSGDMEEAEVVELRIDTDDNVPF